VEKIVALNIEKLLEEISGMTVLELSDLVKALEDKFGVSAAMPMAAAAPVAATVAAAPSDEKAEYKVTIKDGGSQKIAVIKVVRKLISGLSLTDAKKMVEEVPSVVSEAVSKDEAQKMKAELEAAGAKVELS
jgi:large subunit ribosomal protein L7/L12